ncbi:hypothetical protein AKJ63_02125, partial [candidate division MSBL1 archaeon SCGC-AAA259D18]
MDGKDLSESDREGVSPVVGTILIIGITVIAVGGVAYFVMSYKPPKPGPLASLEFKGAKVGAKNFSINHRGGDLLAVNDLTLRINGKDRTGGITSTGTFEAGTSIKVSINPELNYGDRIALVHEPSGAVIAKKTVKEVLPGGGEEEVTPGWKAVEEWTGSVSAPSGWSLIESWSGQVGTLSGWQLIESWSGTIVMGNQPPSLENLVSENITRTSADLAVDVSDLEGDDLSWVAFLDDSDGSVIENYNSGSYSEPQTFTYTWTNLSENTDYAWYSQSADNDGNVGISSVASFTTDPNYKVEYENMESSLWPWIGEYYGRLEVEPL